MVTDTEQDLYSTPLKYEKVEDIILEEVPRGEADSRMRIGVGKGSKEEVLNTVRERVKKCNWWLQDKWREKGLPGEQVVLEAFQGRVEVYNFGQPLEPRHLEELEQVMRIFSVVDGGRVIGQIKYILISEEVKYAITSGEIDNGYNSSTFEHSIDIYAAALENKSHRVNGVTNFLGTLVHEMTHSLADEVENEWNKKFGWSWGAEAHTLPGGYVSTYGLKNPERCVTEYAKYLPSDDICDSMVAALFNPSILDPEKLQFLQEKFNLPTPEEYEPVDIRISRLTGDQVRLPHVQQPIKFSTFPIGI